MPDRKVDVDFGVWGVLRKTALVLVVAFLFIGLALCYGPVLKQRSALQKEYDTKYEALKKQKELYQTYSDEIVALRTDPEAVEREARQKLGLVKPNEIIYHFESPKAEK